MGQRKPTVKKEKEEKRQWSLGNGHWSSGHWSLSHWEIGDMKNFLDEKCRLYNKPEFIATDPVSIPHLFQKKEDREIAGFLAATISWGQRPVILKNAKRLLLLMEGEPYRFTVEAGERELKQLQHFVHRTFNGTDCIFFVKSLRNIYRHHGGLEHLFSHGLLTHGEMGKAIHHVRKIFFEPSHPKRTVKHFSDPLRGAAAKRINMFLRWMVRKDKHGVDFGIWKTISPALLCCPLDVHSARMARKLKLLHRKQNDWKAVTELTQNLKQLDADDPVKYDFALFGLGVFEKF
jgi:uncharacterized protein (TIGR02757 family)